MCIDGAVFAPAVFLLSDRLLLRAIDVEAHTTCCRPVIIIQWLIHDGNETTQYSAESSGVLFSERSGW